MAPKLEILAPAGDEAMLRAAVFSGADCVYLGVRGFNARRGAQNFDEEQLAQAVAFCHARNCGVYAAINTLVFPGKEQELYSAVAAAANAGCDAVIVQDIAAALAVRELAPSLELHASTQMSVHSLAGVQKLAELGFSRAILARELSEEEIRAICEKSPIQLEVFVHGALCVSVSGQCYASAFLGGRSANRGGCAGPCRLPFRAACGAGAQGAAPPAAEEYHLSLKDLSILDALPRLQAMGVASAKIEGRLRGPEYCALVVDAAQKALNGEEYDKALIQNVFSRSGFTDGWFTGKNDGEMFGARTGADTAATKAALPKARELYRRERPRVPVQMELDFGAHGGALCVTDGANTVRRRFGGPLPTAERDGSAALAAALSKTGGTPFYLQAPPVVASGGAHLPAAEAGRLRKEVLEELLEIRQRPSRGQEYVGGMAASMRVIGGGQNPFAAAARAKRAKTGTPPLRAWFQRLQGMPKEAAECCDILVLPLFEAEGVPRELRGKTFLWLPRVLFGPLEEKAAKEVQKTKDAGFAGYEAGNIAHYKLCQGLPMAAGFGLNITNATSLAVAAGMGCVTATLSPELSLAQMKALVEGPLPAGMIATDALCYGHLPLMLTRACPVKQVADCGACRGDATLTDRKGERLRLECENGVRQLYNPVPLWMADRQKEIPADMASLYFTGETAREAEAVLRAFARGEKAEGPFTRGLYLRGTEA